jgi:hypothetical protein
LSATQTARQLDVSFPSSAISISNGRYSSGSGEILFNRKRFSHDPSRLTSSSFVIIAKNKDFKSLFYEIVLFLELSDYDLLDADCKILEEGDNFSRLLGYAGW